MFRKIKKLYFKIYHLFKLLGVFILIFGMIGKVNAEVTKVYSCSTSDNKIKTGQFIQGYQNPYGTAKPVNNWDITYGEIIEVNPETAYNFKFITTPTATEPYRVSVMYYDSSENYISNYDIRTTSPYFYQRITTPANTKYMILGLYGISDTNANSVVSVLYEGTQYKNSNMTEPIIEYNQCSTPEPPEPEPEDNVYSEFLTLYLNRVTYLAEGFTTNPYLLAMVGIIFGFIVLEITLKILNIRRKK